MIVARHLSLLIFILLVGEHAYGAEQICSNSAVVFCDDFEQGNFAQWEDGYNSALHRITSVTTNVYQGQKALEATYPAGSDGGWLTRWFMPGYDDAYARLYVKFEQEWQCGQNCSKILAFYGNRIDDPWSGFGQAGTRPDGTDFFYSGLATLNWYRHPDPGEIIFYSYFPEMQPAPDGKYWGNFFFQNDPRDALQPGRWYCLELELKANTPGLHNGLQKMWIDGSFKGEVSNMRWRDTTNLRINAFQLTFSGAVPVTQHVWIDNVVVSTQKIGCLANAKDSIPPAPPTGLRVQ
jgi:hypothetical protein